MKKVSFSQWENQAMSSIAWVWCASGIVFVISQNCMSHNNTASWLRQNPVSVQILASAYVKEELFKNSVSGARGGGADR